MRDHVVDVTYVDAYFAAPMGADLSRSGRSLGRRLGSRVWLRLLGRDDALRQAPLSDRAARLLANPAVESPLLRAAELGVPLSMNDCQVRVTCGGERTNPVSLGEALFAVTEVVRALEAAAGRA